jgi:predicted  nucleic acid-binding Zn-ribbon protein
MTLGLLQALCVCLFVSILTETVTGFGRYPFPCRSPLSSMLNMSIDSSSTSKPSVEEAAAITEFMARAHEEKIAALARMEAKYKDQIAQLEERLAELEHTDAYASPKTTPTSGNSYAFPATNKELTNKVAAYRSFISDYIIKAQEEKAKAVKAAEEKLKAKYEAIISELNAGDSTLE